jgi:hypothetical protein
MGLSVARRTEIERRFADCWWSCKACHRTYPKNYRSDFCDFCDLRLTRNDDIRLALLYAAEDEARHTSRGRTDA